MVANQGWLEANLGGAPVRPLAGEVPAGTPEDLALERIEFDSEAPEGMAVAAGWPKAPPTLDHFVDVPWPGDLAPSPAGELASGDSLPEADVLIVTWTTEEGHALSRVLTPGFDSQPPTKSHPAKEGVGSWRPYTKNYDAIAKTMRPTCPARNAKRLGTYWTTRIGERSVTLFKSDSHMSQDGPRVPETTPNRVVWEQLIDDCKPRWVITTGTGGGIGEGVEVGDVVVSRFVNFAPRAADAKTEHFRAAHDAPDARFAEATALCAPNAGFLPSTNRRPPQIMVAGSAQTGVVTTPGFEYDDTAGTFHLKHKGRVCEMGDAVLGVVCEALGDAAPEYVVVRNVSDPEIDSSDPHAGALANYIYEHFGRWSSVCSAIVCWSIVAAL